MNKTNLLTDKELRELTEVFEAIKKNNGALILKGSASNNFVMNAISGDYYVAECWALAVLAKLNDLGYEIKKKV